MDVLTNRYDASRAGVNKSEETLNQGNVNVNGFGKLFTRGVDGQIYAQPLIVSDLKLPGLGTRSIVVVATTRNMVYAFDANEVDACHPIWRTRVDAPNGTPVHHADYADFTSEIGITSTPVIDRRRKKLYLTSKSKEVLEGKPHYYHKLHSIDLSTGAEKRGSPATIAETIVNDFEKKRDAVDFTFVSGPSAPGSGSGSANGKIAFNSFFQHQRPGLLLQDNAIYIAFGSHGDYGDYHGWILAYDAAKLALITVYCTTPDWSEGGIWQSGCGLAGDGEGCIFAVCGNGGIDKHGNYVPPNDRLLTYPGFGHSVLKLKLDRRTRKLKLMSSFTPMNIKDCNEHDVDLCAGPVILPWRNLVGAWGKDRAYYIMDRNGLGGFDPNQNRIAQYAPDMTTPQNPGGAGGTGHIHCAPVMFDGAVVGPVSYVWGENDRLRGYRFAAATGQFETHSPANLISDTVLPIGMPGGMLTVSCNGTAPRTAIVWALHPTAGNANHQTVAGTLQAYRADDLRQAIWSSNHDPRGADDLGDFAKFCPPVVANGKVYVATFSQQLVVYGLLKGATAARLGTWQQADVPIHQPGTFQVEGTASYSCARFTILGAGHDIWGTGDSFYYVYQTAPTASTIILTARVVDVQNTNPWAKAGVMIRETLNPDSAHAMMVVTPENGAAFQHRPGKGAASVHMPFTDPVRAPYWVRIQRAVRRDASFEFMAFVSADGAAWSQVGTPISFAMSGAGLVGIAVTSHDDQPNVQLQDLCVAVIDRVALQAE